MSGDGRGEDSVLGRGMACGQSWGLVGMGHRTVWQASSLVYPHIFQS